MPQRHPRSAPAPSSRVAHEPQASLPVPRSPPHHAAAHSGGTAYVRRLGRALRQVRQGRCAAPGRPLPGLRQPVLQLEVPGAQRHSAVAAAGAGRPYPRGGDAVPFDQSAARGVRPGVPAGPPVRRQLHAGGIRRGDHRRGREVHRGYRAGQRLEAGPAGGAAQRQTGRHRRCRPGRAGLRRSPGARRHPGRGIRPLRTDRRPAAVRHSQFQAREARDRAPSRDPRGHGRTVPAGRGDRPRHQHRAAAG